MTCERCECRPATVALARSLDGVRVGRALSLCDTCAGSLEGTYHL